MKKSLLSAMVLGLVTFSSLVKADYINPPGWNNNSYFTHQVWEFNSDTNPAVADVNGNPYGNPVSTINGATWSGGAWKIVGTDGTIDLYIPNEANPLLTKEVWFQLTFNTNVNAFAYTTFEILTSSPTTTKWQWENVDPVDPSSGRYRYSAIWTINPQPDSETIHIGAKLSSEPNGFLSLDQVSVDTRCIPEPATLTLLGLGLVSVLRRK